LLADKKSVDELAVDEFSSHPLHLNVVLSKIRSGIVIVGTCSKELIVDAVI
jgi:hypothetical protein